MPVASLNEFSRVVPEEFLRKVEKLWSTQLKDLRKILGNPPDISRVKPEHWQEWKKQQEAALILLMGGSAMNQLRSQLNDWQRIQPDDTDTTDIERRFLRNIRSRARFASQRITRTTRQRVTALLRDYGSETTTPAGRGSFDISNVLDRARAEMVTVTEITAASTASIRAIYESFLIRGVQCQLVWRLRPCNHCEVCPLLDGLPDSFWQRFTNGPPIHPHCCCQLVILLGSRAELIRTGQMNRNPSVAGVRAAIQRSGFRL